MNRDLKEKGLRQPRAGQPRALQVYEPRPEREGIKTKILGIGNRWYPMNRDLKEKGLRRDLSLKLISGDPMNRDLKEKGLRPPPPVQIRRTGPMNRDLKEKGLRPQAALDY